MESNGGTMIVENCEVRADIEQSNTRSWLGKNVQKITGCTVNAPVKQITTLRWKSHQQIIENQEINQPVIQRNGGYVCEN